MPGWSVTYAYKDIPCDSDHQVAGKPQCKRFSRFSNEAAELDDVCAHDIAFWQFFERRPSPKSSSEPPDGIEHHGRSERKIGIYYHRRPNPLSRRESSSEVKNMLGRGVYDHAGAGCIVRGVITKRTGQTVSILHQKMLRRASRSVELCFVLDNDDQTQYIYRSPLIYPIVSRTTT